MIVKSIRISYGMLYSRCDHFTKGFNLIHSQKNSVGKTTLIRFLLYSLGYSIPSTRKIRFNDCVVETDIVSDNAGELRLTRASRDYVVVEVDSERKTYTLPENQNELHSLIFGTSNEAVLQNLLGAYYVDQEKGWTLLNRGVVIGDIRFNIERLIQGLSERDCERLIQREKKAFS